MVDEIAVPDRLENAVGQAERQDVLDRLFPQVMVDAIDLRLAEDRLDRVVQVARARQVDAERLFDHQADETLLVAPLIQASITELGGDGLEELWRRGEIEHAVPLRAVRRVDLVEALTQGAIAFGLVELT